MRKCLNIILAVFCLAASLSVCPTADAGMPRASDICFSSRWIRPKDKDDTYNTLQAAETYGATRIDWLYIKYFQTDYVENLRAQGYRCSLALNSILPDDPCSWTFDRGRVLDIEGNKVTAPWMKTWGVYWGCANRPEYRKTFFEHAKMCIDAGATSLHVDDPFMNKNAVRWGGCFCDRCVEDFRQWLKRNHEPQKLKEMGIEDIDSFDYRAYRTAGHENDELKNEFHKHQNESVRGFFRDMMQKADAYAGRKVPFSGNNWNGKWESPYDLFDFGIAEMSESLAHPSNIYQCYSHTAALGKAQIFTLVSYDVTLNRKTLALCYALGGHMICPWDVFMGSSKPRFFADPKDFTDLYGLPKAYPHYFDNYVTCAAGGYELPEDADSPAPVEIVSDGAFVTFCLRKHEQDSRAPQVLHLVDWADERKDFKLRLKKSHFKCDESARPMLIKPGLEWPIPPQCVWRETVVEIPPLEPWGMLILPPDIIQTETSQ